MIMKLYTPKEIADILKFNYRKVLDMIHLGEIDAFKIGKDYRISENQLQMFLNDRVYKSYWKKQE